MHQRLSSVDKIIRDNFRGRNCAETAGKAMGYLLNVDTSKLHKSEDETSKCRAISSVSFLLAENSKTTVKEREDFQQVLDFLFKDFFGDTCCRLLNGDDFLSYEHLCRCYRINSAAVKLAARWWCENIS